ncbi:MAG: hypothetical protein L6R39_006742 [Caloplaca ligustica]|nr:MAG: hypothetical protein L6R39_006742 [Caloplaca ligustica]
MEAEEDDDIYAPGVADKTFQATNGKKSADVEEGEEADSDEEEESDSDIDIITERKDEPKTEPIAAQPRISAAKAQPGRTPSISADLTSKQPRSPVVKVETTGKATPTSTKPGSSYPSVRTSSIDVDAKPIHGPTGKPITEVDMDAG